MSAALPLRALRLSLLAAAGIHAAACGKASSTPGTGGSSTTSTSSTTATGTGGSTTTSGTAGAGPGGAGGHGGAPFVDPVCAGAVPIASRDGTPSGFARCPDDTLHRIAPATCDATIDAPACGGTEMHINCTSDADCTAGAHGRCISNAVIEDAGLVTSCDCAYSCVSDEECGAGQVCICAGVLPIEETWSQCANATCVTGADCPTGECAASVYYNGCFNDIEVACRNPTDACRTDADCAGDGGEHKRCVMSEGTWQCLGWTCILGRPLVVEGRARVAAPADRADWTARVTPDVTTIDPESRAALAAYWMEAAAAEHASVASFARFTLELLALGAPAALVAEAQRAGRDEVEHARLAYGLASAYAGREIGPAPLDLSALCVATDRREIMRALIEEACVGETLGVAEALAQAAAAQDPALVRAHRRIAADEQRHAELAWRTLAWLIEGEADRRFAGRCFEVAMAAAERGGAPGLAAVRRQTLREVVGPCAAAVVG